MEVLSLGSGSSGNCFLISADGVHLLVDCGVSRIDLDRHLTPRSIALNQISATVVSHEHGDHVRSLPRVQGRGVPVHGTRGTLHAVGCGRSAGVMADGKPVSISGFTVTAISVSHDAAEPCGFAISRDGVRVVILTDAGRPEPHFLPYLAEAHLIVIEANHDRRMLRDGPYPEHLKRRIVSGNGHLSNNETGELLAAAIGRSESLPTIWLAHLSKTNNRPEIAVATVEQALRSQGMNVTAAALKPKGGETWPGPGVAQLGFRFDR